MSETLSEDIEVLIRKLPNHKIQSLYKSYRNLASVIVLQNILKHPDLSLEPFKEKGLSYRENCQSTDKNIYTGQVDEKNRRHGFGILLYSDKSLYIGYFKASFCKGLGRLYSYTGNVYEGRWKANILRGLGKIFYADGRKYEGDTIMNNPHGFGTLELPGSWRYEGQFVEGFQQGKGKLEYSNGDVYQGNFFKDKMEGKGRLITREGSVYVGSFHKNKMHGHGTYRFVDKYEYVGDFCEGMKDGHGKIVYLKSKLTYDGYWRNDKQDGKGVETKPNGLRIEALWKNGAIIECYNDALEEIGDIHPAYQKKELAENIEELMDKVYASRHGATILTEKEKLEDIETIRPVPIEPYTLTFDNKEILKYLYELSSIVITHSLYSLSYKVYKEEPDFQYIDPEFTAKKVRFNNQWEPIGEDGAVYKGEIDKKSFFHGRGVILHKGKIFHGFFEKSKKNGFGREIYPNGVVFEGNWANDKKNGFGIEKCLDKTMYIGDWEDDKKQGLGVMVTKDWKFEGNWKNNLQEGYGEILFYSDKSKFKGEFHKGKMHGFGCLIEKDGKSTAGLWVNGVKDAKEPEQKGFKQAEAEEKSQIFSIPDEFSRFSNFSAMIPDETAPAEITK